MKSSKLSDVFRRQLEFDGIVSMSWTHHIMKKQMILHEEILAKQVSGCI